MKRLFNFLFKKKKEEVVEPTNDHGKCTKCRFADFDNNRCTVGSYYAEKGFNKICYEGELWEVKED